MNHYQMLIQLKNNLFENPKLITDYDPKTWKYIVYAEIYDFSVSYGETYDKGKLNKTNTTIIGIQIRMVNVDNSQYIVASGQGTSTQVGEGYFKNPTMSFDQSTVGIATQRALEKATFNLIGRMEKNGW